MNLVIAAEFSLSSGFWRPRSKRQKQTRNLQTGKQTGSRPEGRGEDGESGATEHRPWLRLGVVVLLVFREKLGQDFLFVDGGRHTSFAHPFIWEG